MCAIRKLMEGALRLAGARWDWARAAPAEAETLGKSPG